MLKLTEEQISELQKAMRKHIEEEADQSVAELDKTLDVAVDKLVAERWTLPAGLPITAVNALGKSSEIDDVNVFMEDFYSADNYRNMKKLIYDIQNSRIKAGLIKVTSECWQAFQNKLYTVCATSLISVIEGILSEFSEDKRNIKMMMVCQKQVNDFPADGSTIAKHVWISYNDFIRNLYQKREFTCDEPTEINRHWILHGRSNFEIEEIDCMRLFNAVYSLCMVINKEKK